MSAHSSPFSFDLSQLILSKGKRYIAMLGGRHYSNTQKNIEYYKNANHILVHTKAQKNEMLKIDFFKGLDIRIFPLGVDLEKFYSLEINKNSNCNLLYVGRITEFKRVHLAVEVLNNLIKNGFLKASLKIIGPISSLDYYEKIKLLIKKYNINKNIEFLGEKKHSDLITYYQNADMLLLPSDQETFGMVMVEAMACGTPVAAINCLGGPSEVIKNNFNGILTPLENYSLSIYKYFSDPTNQIKIKKNAIQTVLNDYSLKNTYAALQKSIND